MCICMLAVRHHSAMKLHLAHAIRAAVTVGYTRSVVSLDKDTEP